MSKDEKIAWSQVPELRELAAVLAKLDIADRRDAVERAILLANEQATLHDIDSFAFDWSGTWNEGLLEERAAR